MKKGFLVLDSGEVYSGKWEGGKNRAGEVVFNTSHFGYEEMATDPSYYSQILVLTSPMQGNYGAHKEFHESPMLSIEGFICLEIQNSERESSWLKRLTTSDIPVLTEIDTRGLVLRLRDKGTPWGALVAAADPQEAIKISASLIEAGQKKDRDWVYAVSRKEIEILQGEKSNGPRVAILDFGTKENIIRELRKRSREVAIFPSRATALQIQKWEPTALFLTNGPGDPLEVKQATETIKELLGWRPVFGICMGHQILARALGLSTFKLKFGHRGGNHPVQDLRSGRVYVTSQNHGYAVDLGQLTSGISPTHINLNDKTNEGLECPSKKCQSVQFHPESCPGPNDAREIFDHFVEWVK
ncbi:MAG: glutamine-hydrolyzing carbamoyl-phosphate synthase small subunit [Pseudomonadota bacterium]|nr:glutamine-hydrolyzing carbamoyl-phosphate synthase small subunit [Pseudomonadota bacterium]